jgi:hypothetical protein
MTKETKIGLTILGIIVLIPICYFAYMHFVMVGLFNSIDQSMAAGQIYMDSLTEKDIHIWEERTKKYLDEYVHGEADFYDKDVPLELRQLGILGVHKDTNWVSYIWVGGFDHTSLEVERMTDGHFQFTAEYSDESNKVIWPKMTNVSNPQTNLTFQLQQ